MQVAQLEPGDCFRVDYGRHGHEDFRLIYVNQCRAYVEPLMKKKTIIKKSELSDILGDQVEFETKSGKVNIAPATECEKLNVTDVADSPDAAPGEAYVPRKRGESSEPARAWIKPVRPGTVREKVLALLCDGKAHPLEASAKKLEMDKNLLVAHVKEAAKQNGHGYKVSGDTIAVFPPLADNSEDLSDII